MWQLIIRNIISNPFQSHSSFLQEKKYRPTFGTEREFVVGCLGSKWNHIDLSSCCCTGSESHVSYCDALGDPEFYIFISWSHWFCSVNTPNTCKKNPNFTWHTKKYHLNQFFLRVTFFLVLNRLFLLWFKVNEISN